MSTLTGNFMVIFSHFREIPGNTLNLVQATKFTIIIIIIIIIVIIYLFIYSRDPPEWI
jgi:heme/copper-type cytochrome/quinol oxidase subunit 4